MAAEVAPVTVFTLEFDRAEEVDSAVRRLELQHQVTGEFHAVPLPQGWRLTVWSEKPLRQGVLERLGGRLVEPES